MAVRLKVKLRSEGGEIYAVALANAGYEVEEPEVTLPEETAKTLGLLPELPKGAKIVEYATVGGGKIKVYWIPKAVEVSVVTEDRTVGPVLSNVAIVAGESEVILSDKLIDALEIVIEKAGEGIWRFRGEQKLRKTESVLS